MDPASGPATPGEARSRIEEALARFDRECRACAQAGGSVASATFGTVSVVDYARFIELHTRHHCKQMRLGSTICYAFMQAVGMVNDHTTDCFRYQRIGQKPAT